MLTATSCVVGCTALTLALITPAFPAFPASPPEHSTASTVGAVGAVGAVSTGRTVSADRTVEAGSTVSEAASFGAHTKSRSPGDRAGPGPPTGTVENRAWPVSGQAGVPPAIVHPWSPPPAPWAPGHRGVDLGTASGATVRAAAPGRVTYAGKVAGRGVLSIELPGTGDPPLRTTYEPVRATVHKGDRVAAGQPIAVLQTGPYHCTDPCLHWGLRRGTTTYLDPLSLLPPALLAAGHSRLLPVFGVPEPAPEPEPASRSTTPTPPPPGFPIARTGSTAPLWTTTALALAVVLTAAGLWSRARLRHPAQRGPGPPAGSG